MSQLRSQARRGARRLSVLAVGAAFVGVSTLALPSAGASADESRHGLKNGWLKQNTDVQLLAINDFHGNLEPPAGSSGAIQTGVNPVTKAPVTVPAGGVAYLATHLQQARAGHPNSVTIGAGDLIGASPLLSGAFHDEPTIEAMNAIGLEVTSVGNHEFDEGRTELLRMQNGGCRKDAEGNIAADSCPAGTFSGANFQYLAANVVDSTSHRTILPPYWIKKIGGVKVGFIGMTLKGTPDIVTAAGVAGLTFKDEVQTANRYALELQLRGVQSIVVLLHQGGIPASGVYNYDCNAGGALGLTGDVVDIAKNLAPSIDLVVTGHTHTAYTCDIPDRFGRSRMVTSAASFGRLYTDIDLKINKWTGDVQRSSVSAQNMVVTRDVTPDPTLSALVAKYQALVAPVAGRQIGVIAGTILGRGCGEVSCPASGESPAGDLIADAQLWALKNDPLNTAGADFAIMNPGGIRADFVCPTAGACPVTYGAAFTVQPFTNVMKVVDLSGADVLTMFGQQWVGQSAGQQKILQVSANVRYTYAPGAAPNTDKVVPGTLTVDGVPIDPARTYHVVMNEFLAGGGDGFVAIKNGTIVHAGPSDLDALVGYLGAFSSTATPYPVPAADRIAVS